MTGIYNRDLHLTGQQFIPVTLQGPRADASLGHSFCLCPDKVSGTVIHPFIHPSICSFIHSFSLPLLHPPPYSTLSLLFLIVF